MCCYWQFSGQTVYSFYTVIKLAMNVPNHETFNWLRPESRIGVVDGFG